MPAEIETGSACLCASSTECGPLCIIDIRKKQLNELNYRGMGLPLPPGGKAYCSPEDPMSEIKTTSLHVLEGKVRSRKEHAVTSGQRKTPWGEKRIWRTVRHCNSVRS